MVGIHAELLKIHKGNQLDLQTLKAERQTLIAQSLVAGVYEKAVDRESAFEAIKGRTQSRMAEPAQAKEAVQTMSKTVARDQPATTANGASSPQPVPASQGGGFLDSLGNLLGGGARRTRTSAGEQLVKSAASAVGREVGRQIIRGVLGGIFGGGRR